MTCEEWMRSEDPRAMLDACRAALLDFGDEVHGVEGAAYRGHDISDRKLWLWCVALNLSNGAHIRKIWWRGSDRFDADMGNEAPPEGFTARTQSLCWCDPTQDQPGDPPMAARAALLRDIVGDPFAPVTLPESVTGGPDVRSLALAAYESRRPDGTLDDDRLAVLSDALEEAGCVGVTRRCPDCGGSGKHVVQVNSASTRYNGEPCYGCGGVGTLTAPHPLLAHLRPPGPHVRGCWALDLILGKE